MIAVVLVGGEGTRLRPLTLSTPKQMLPIVEVPMIERVLEKLASHGIREAVLSLGYLPDAFMGAFPDGTAAGVRLAYAVEPAPLDTAGAIRFAARHAGVGETFVVVNGDVLTDLDLDALVAFHRASGAEGTIALHPVGEPSRYGVVPTDDHGRVTAFVEKPSPGEEPTNLINAGTYVLEPRVLERIAEGRRVSIEREIFPAMAAAGTLYALGDSAYWLDTGTPIAFLEAQLDLLDGTRGCAPPVAGAARAPGGYWKLGSPLVHGEVRGPAFVADGAVIEDGACVEAAVIGQGCVVGAGSQVVRSVLMSGARVGSGALVSGSLVGAGARIGSGSALRPVSVIGAGAAVPSATVVEGGSVPG